VQAGLQSWGFAPTNGDRRAHLMHSEFLGAGIALHGLLAATTTTAKAKSSASSTGFLILILVVLGAYLLFIRPQRAKLRAQQQAGPAVDIGDEVMTTSGIIGRVQRFENDRVILEVAPGTNITIFRNAIGRRLDPRPDDFDYYPPPEDPSDSGENGSDDNRPAGEDHPAEGESPWWPGHNGDASPSSGGST
jgi:preprotein translocase subunit YajC